jgi:hypothetical protein
MESTLAGWLIDGTIPLKRRLAPMSRLVGVNGQLPQCWCYLTGALILALRSGWPEVRILAALLASFIYNFF